MKLISSVDLGKYIDDSGEVPIIRNTTVPVATVAYRALSGSWALCTLAYEFTLEEVEILAALLYYQQYCERIDSQMINPEFEFDAMD